MKYVRYGMLILVYNIVVFYLMKEFVVTGVEPPCWEKF